MNLEDRTISELRKIAKDNQIRLEQGIKKKELIQLLEAYMKENTANVVEPVDEDALFDHDLGEMVLAGEREKMKSWNLMFQILHPQNGMNMLCLILEAMSLLIIIPLLLD